MTLGARHPVLHLRPMLGALLLFAGCAAHRAGTASIAEVEGDGNQVETAVGLVNKLDAEVSVIKQIGADKADIAGVKTEIAQTNNEMHAQRDFVQNNYGTKKDNYTTEIAFGIVQYVLGSWRTARQLKKKAVENGSV